MWTQSAHKRSADNVLFAILCLLEYFKKGHILYYLSYISLKLDITPQFLKFELIPGKFSMCVTCLLGLFYKDTIWTCRDFHRLVKSLSKHVWQHLIQENLPLRWKKYAKHWVFCLKQRMQFLSQQYVVIFF